MDSSFSSIGIVTGFIVCIGLVIVCRITSVDQVELKFHIYNAESYDTIADSDAITFTAQ
nr:hypothetical protein [uncultured Agathobacter sp.]